jgi:hypothetical protein
MASITTVPTFAAATWRDALGLAVSPLPFETPGYEVSLLWAAAQDGDLGAAVAAFADGTRFSAANPSYAITNPERSRLLAITIPRQQFKGMKIPDLHTCEAHTPAMRGLYAVLGSFLTSLADQLPSLPDAVGRSVSDTVLSLLASTLATHSDEQFGVHPVPAC